MALGVAAFVFLAAVAAAHAYRRWERRQEGRPPPPYEPPPHEPGPLRAGRGDVSRLVDEVDRFLRERGG